MQRWAGRVALVTGASSGIGASLAERLVRKGMKVVGCARNLEKLQELKSKVADAPGSFLAVKCDLTKEDEILAMFETIRQQYGCVDVCINNAGQVRDGELIHGQTDEWRIMWEVNVMAVCICTREALKLMKEKGVTDGHIVHIGSDSGRSVDATKILHFYDATKFAVNALAEGLRLELREEGSKIKVTTLTPGWVKTAIMNQVWSKQEVAKAFSSPHLSPEDLADALEYVLSAPPHLQVQDIFLTNVEQAPIYQA